jgi:hypothetical protein
MSANNQYTLLCCGCNSPADMKLSECKGCGKQWSSVGVRWMKNNPSAVKEVINVPTSLKSEKLPDEFAVDVLSRDIWNTFIEFLIAGGYTTPDMPSIDMKTSWDDISDGFKKRMHEALWKTVVMPVEALVKKQDDNCKSECSSCKNCHAEQVNKPQIVLNVKQKQCYYCSTPFYCNSLKNEDDDLYCSSCIKRYFRKV